MPPTTEPMMTTTRIASLPRSAVTQPARLVSLLLIAAAGCGGDAPVHTATPVHNGSLQLGDERVAIATSFCVADAGNFGAVGTGITGSGTPLVVTVKSPDRLAVRFGVVRELDEPPPGAARLAAARSALSLQADGRRITAAGTLLHEPDRELATAASLELSC